MNHTLASVLVALLIILAGYYLLIAKDKGRNGESKQFSPQITEHLAIMDTEANAVPSSSSSTKPRRLLFLDNIKVFLTAMVVLHHVTCFYVGSGWTINIAGYPNSFQPFGSTLLGLNQSYFMCLFFFMSGYFTPNSYDRKGSVTFLKDKFLRLGLPFFAYLFGFGPVRRRVSIFFCIAYTF